jgi:hypothetical protein
MRPSARRDLGFDRIGRTTRFLAVGAIVAGGVLSAAVAKVLPGRSVHTPANSTTGANSGTNSGSAAGSSGSGSGIGSSSSGAGSGLAPTSSDPALNPPAQAPQPSVSPPVVSSGGS